MIPPSEHVHWLFAAGLLFVGLLLVAEAIVGSDVWRRRRWRAYLFPSLAFAVGLMLWPVMVFFTNSAVHMLAHGVWAQTMTVAGAAQLGLVHGKLRDRRWELTLPLALFVSGIAFLVHEQNGWLFSRSAFLHHTIGWTLVLGSLLSLGRCYRPRSAVFSTGFAVFVLVLAVMLFADRDSASIFGHMDQLAGTPRR
jgi:hypothetical protein